MIRAQSRMEKRINLSFSRIADGTTDAKSARGNEINSSQFTNNSPKSSQPPPFFGSAQLVTELFGCFFALAVLE
jgi:hypothetical protein